MAALVLFFTSTPVTNQEAANEGVRSIPRAIEPGGAVTVAQGLHRQGPIMSFRAIATTCLWVVFLPLTGCVDPEGKFNDFVDRVGQTALDSGIPDAARDAPGDAGPCVVEPGFVEGTYLLTLSIFIQPGTPIIMSAELSTPEFQGATGLEISATPLRADDRKTPVGNPIAVGPVAVQDSGDFMADITGLDVAGEANPISGGQIAADVTLSGNICGDPSFFCGAIGGMVSQPLPINDLTGSTFTLLRLEAGQEPPARPPINCARDLANPLP